MRDALNIVSYSLLQITQDFVEFSRGGELLFERACPQIAANLLERLDHLIDHPIEIVAVRKDYIAPDRIGAPGKAQRVAVTRALRRTASACTARRATTS